MRSSRVIAFAGVALFLAAALTGLVVLLKQGTEEHGTKGAANLPLARPADEARFLQVGSPTKAVSEGPGAPATEEQFLDIGAGATR